MSRSVRNNIDEERFELDVDGQIAFVTYRRSGDVVALLHTEVPRELSGKGVGTELGLGVLDLLRREGLRVDPKCAFIAHLLEKHPEYRPMVVRRA